MSRVSRLWHNEIRDVARMFVTEDWRHHASHSNLLVCCSPVYRRSRLSSINDSADLVVCRLAVVGRVTAHIAHDVNNSMTALLGRLQILIMRGTRGPVDVGTEIESMEHDAQEVSEQIQGLAALARQARRVETPTLCVPSDILREVDHILGHHLRRKGLNIQLDLPSSLPPALARPIDIKLLVAGVALSFLEGTAHGGDLGIIALEQQETIQITLKITGRTDTVSVMPELERLARLTARDGVVVTLPLPSEDAACLLVPIGTQDHYNARRA
jgi:C4-dicarboxylate-specific signal transduction histidine kinase